MLWLLKHDDDDRDNDDVDVDDDDDEVQKLCSLELFVMLMIV